MKTWPGPFYWLHLATRLVEIVEADNIDSRLLDECHAIDFVSHLRRKVEKCDGLAVTLVVWRSRLARA